MMTTLNIKRALLGVVLAGCLIFAAPTAFASDMATAAGSPIAGISFDDRPLMLPVQRNFQMAMLTASSELGRSCGRMEAYGWRMAAEEQDRVNVIFNNTVDRMRAQGYAVESKTTSAVSRDVTLFTADRTDRHLIFLWSAGEIGLVMVLCETSAPLPAISDRTAHTTESVPQPATFPSHLPMAETVRGTMSKSAATDKPAALKTSAKTPHVTFSPTGKWTGTYTCAQGTTGATLQIDKVKGDQFEGSFSFYPTTKNPYVASGKYLVFGEYDVDSQRILLNPGRWINRPKDFYNTIMIGSFDSVNMTFSGYFQGITGCTSFEATSASAHTEASSVVKKAKAATVKKAPAPVKKKKAAVKKDAAVTSEQVAPAAITPAPAATPRGSAIDPPVGIILPPPAP